jgi:hypothetical protein
MNELSQAEVFPLIRAGGVLLLVVGVSIVLGALFFRARYLVWTLDGVLKAAAGALMFNGHNLPCSMCLSWSPA